MKIRVLREAGGIGDILRALPVVRALREDHPDAVIDVFAPEPYAWFVERAGCATRVIRTPPSRRPRLASPDETRWPYLKTGLAYDVTVDLYCPAFQHEASHGREVWNDRIELFCRAAGVRPRVMTPHLPVSADETEAARALLAARGIPERKGWVALQPFSTDPARDWPPEHWRALAERLREDGWGVFALDAVPGRATGFVCPTVCGLPFALLSAVLKVVRLLAGPDSGLAHLAGAVGGAAFGLTASQSGAVLYRYYPNHSYVQPAEAPKLETDNLQFPVFDCHDWPCYWSRPRSCQRQMLKDAGRTCPALGTLDADTVFEAIVAHLQNGPGRMPAEMPPLRPGFDPRPVHALLPERGRVVDAGGVLSNALAAVRCPATQVFESTHQIPIPHRDRSQDHVALFASPPQGHEPVRGLAGDWLWEAFRVLKVGGRLYAPHGFVRIPGFARERDGIGFSVWRKASTWPKQ